MNRCKAFHAPKCVYLISPKNTLFIPFINVNSAGEKSLLELSPKEILTRLAPSVEIGTYRTDFWKPDAPRKFDKQTIRGGTATFEGNTICAFNYGKEATEESLCIKDRNYTFYV